MELENWGFGRVASAQRIKYTYPLLFLSCSAIHSREGIAGKFRSPSLMNFGWQFYLTGRLPRSWSSSTHSFHSTSLGICDGWRCHSSSTLRELRFTSTMTGHWGRQTRTSRLSLTRLRDLSNFRPGAVVICSSPRHYNHHVSQSRSHPPRRWHSLRQRLVRSGRPFPRSRAGM